MTKSDFSISSNRANKNGNNMARHTAYYWLPIDQSKWPINANSKAALFKYFAL